tara:strand:+ start:338 stop:844 length:507 start_codon:yes stop_codon:yes gene_type:complete
MGLLQVATNTVTSAVASVTLTGIDTEDCVYMVTVNNFVSVNDGTTLRAKVTVSGTEQTTSNYQRANKALNASASFSNDSNTQAAFYLANAIGSAANEQTNLILYLYNFYKSDEFSFISNEVAGINSSGQLHGRQGGAAYKVAEAHDGLHFFAGTGNIESGTFTLYKVV